MHACMHAGGCLRRRPARAADVIPRPSGAPPPPAPARDGSACVAQLPADEAPHVPPRVAVVPHADALDLLPGEPTLLQESLVHGPRADPRRHYLAPEDAAGELAERPDTVARLLADLALGGLARRLARVRPAAGEVPAWARAVGDPHHQDLAATDDEAGRGVRGAVAEARCATAREVAVHPPAVVPGPRVHDLLLCGAARPRIRDIRLLLLRGQSAGIRLLLRGQGADIRHLGMAPLGRELTARLHEQMVRAWLQR
mmetsp:Transcript_91686/g.285793  ORF Transcript_91686/g.285793 Transcript_91686/m.285793 type:complete len:256 (-) Transcript_91686:225-992(-)